MKKAIFRIYPDGNLKLINIEGAGQACDQLAKEFESVLGEAVEDTREHTTEYYNQTESAQDQTQNL